jgi:hypothetical protein
VTTPNSSEEAEQPTTSLTAAQIVLSDPLKEETRKARLYLLVVSVVGIIMVWTGLVPKEISTLGISFEDVKPESLLDILAFVIFLLSVGVHHLRHLGRSRVVACVFGCYLV